MITESQHDAFQSLGLLRLERFLPADEVIRTRDVVIRALGRHGCVQRDGMWDFTGLEQLPQFSDAAGHHKVRSTLKQGVGLSHKLIPAELLDAVQTLAGGAVVPMNPSRRLKPALLLSVPNAKAWAVPPNGWHVDLPKLRNRGTPPGVQLFALLDTVRPGGGGTVVVTGSHRLLDGVPFLGPSMKHAKRLRRLPFFADLMSEEPPNRARLMSESHREGDVDLQVVELHGGPGDVCLVDMRVLHAEAPNASRAPRMMFTQRFTREDVLDEMMLASGPNSGYAAEAVLPAAQGARGDTAQARVGI